ncbi:AMP-binding protein [Roseospira navarrensis]|uniref:AMP-binding protein n=1 Tax=Roseospira navarrensis TaxID=140058 RepID=A0A7X1ZEF8_9PROT|nr:AMP-binding protein [Roseospira navarrensis]MQX37049.1 AMP-binding protein [Roseospira navarrensis]
MTSQCEVFDNLIQPWIAAVRRDPNAPAVRDGARVASRVEGLARAIGIADRVCRLPDPGDQNPVVLVHGHKSVGAVVAILGILLSGRAYAYVEAETPPEAMRAILETLRPQAILATESVHPSPGPASSGAAPTPVIAVEACPPGALSWLDAPPPGARAAADEIAYVLFSSGSTGVPKGVCMARDAAHAAVAAYCRDLGITETDRLASSVSFGFDVSMFDILAAARTGACLMLLRGVGGTGVEPMGRALAGSGATVAFTVPSLAGAMIAAPEWPQTRPHLRALALTGERVTPDLRGALATALAPATTVWNLFGGTEMPYVLADPLAMDGDGDPSRFTRRGGPVALGLDGDFSADAWTPGREGELWVEGAAVLSGYLAPGASWPGRVPAPRRHGSGDVFRVLDGARLQYVGRRDRQVRLHGLRIELDMIESWVETHPNAAACVALLDERGPGLAVFVAPGPEAAGGDDLRDAMLRHIRAGLPAYMVPETCRVLESMPRTRTGKKDRTAVRRIMLAGGETAPVGRSVVGA